MHGVSSNEAMRVFGLICINKSQYIYNCCRDNLSELHCATLYDKCCHIDLNREYNDELNIDTQAYMDYYQVKKRRNHTKNVFYTDTEKYTIICASQKYQSDKQKA